MSSKKKGGSPDPAQMIFSELSALGVACIKYLGRSGKCLFKNTIWIFAEAPGAHNDFNDYCRTNFGSAPGFWTKVVIAILFLPLVITILVIWSLLQGFIPD